MLLAVGAILPLLLLGFYSEERDRKERIEAAYRNALDFARQGATAQNEVFASARSLLRVIASARASFNLPNADCNRFLARIAEPIPWIKTFSVADLDGRIFCSSFPGAIGLDISERPYFRSAVEYGGFSISDYFVAARIKAPVITAALAQTGPDGETTAIVVGLLDLSWFENVARTFVPASAAMLMIDGTGTILAQYPNPSPGDLIGQKLDDHPLVKAMLARPEGFVTEAAPDGVRRIFGYVQLPDTSTRIAVGFAESDVLARVNRAMWQAIVEVGLVSFLVLLSIWFGGERLLVRPIRALADTATRIGRGDVKTHAWELPWAAEFVPLAAALDDMAGQLHMREQELRDSNAQLRELAEVDGLTGLGNRRAFNGRFAAECAIAVKLGQPIAILMIDVDHFKLFNDHHGHIQGDDCLRKVGGALIEGTRMHAGGSAPEAELPPSYSRVGGRARRADFAARYGGEEFAVLLQGADIDIALRVAERLRTAVEKLRIVHSGSASGFLSISIGAASVLPTDVDCQQDLVERADAALYQAKRQGRNRVVASTAALSKAG
ncbi:MAG: diguanylate cyclase [Pseudolabrys sp.]|nr:diguanylate cyclase [Pseudolabrys sp.]